LKKIIKRAKNITVKRTEDALQSERGGGLATLFIGLAAIFLAFVIIINIDD
jgi:hypothetical protein